MKPSGIHLLLELKECNSDLLDDVVYIERQMLDAAIKSGATIVGKSFHKFEPTGVTGIVAIAESHLSIHTWPEHEYAAVDIFTCGDSFSPTRAADLIISGMNSLEPSITEIKRGIISTSPRTLV